MIEKIKDSIIKIIVVSTVNGTLINNNIVFNPIIQVLYDSTTI